MNELQIFSNKQFGEIRTVEVDNKIYFVAKDIAIALGYKDTVNAVKQHCKGVVKHHLPTNGGKQLMNVIPEGDLYRLVAHSELPSAEKFESWIFDEVLPTIRKTGTYSIKQESASKEEIQLRRAKAMEINARNRQANLLLKITADPICTKEYKQVIYSKVTQMVAGETLIPLPTAERKTYSATDIAKQFNITKNMIGKIANEHKLKTAEYGKLFYDKSPYSSKQVETWRYYENAIPMFAKILGVEVIGL